MAALAATTFLVAGCIDPHEAPAATVDEGSSPGPGDPSSPLAGTPPPVPDDVDLPLVTRWLNPPTTEELLPGSLLEWNVSGRTIVGVEAVLQVDGRRHVFCVDSLDGCWLPPELPAAKEVQWFLRLKTEDGIAESERFSFRTPASAARVAADTIPAVVPAGVRVTWTLTGDAVVTVLASPVDGGGLVACTGLQSCTLLGLVAGERYAFVLRTVDPRGLVTEVDLGEARVNRGPTEPHPNVPQAGSEVSAGPTRVSWSASQDADGDRVTYVLEHLKDGAWVTQDLGTATSATLDAGLGAVTFWRVAARDEAGNEVRSAVSSFKTPDAPPAAVPLSPTDTKIPPLASRVFEWSASSVGPATVLIRPAGGEWSVSCTGIARCESSAPLKAGMTYEWRVDVDGGYYGRTSSGSASFSTVSPVILIHGLLSDGATWGVGGGLLRAAGLDVVDFDPAPGIQPLTYSPPSGDVGIAGTARDVESLVASRLDALGYDSGTGVILIGHSMGGLIGRQLGSAVGSHAVEQLITLGTPHLGSLNGVILDVAIPKLMKLACKWVLAAVIPATMVACAVLVPLIEGLIKGDWRTAIQDLSPFSGFLDDLNAQPPPVPYHAVAAASDLLVGTASATYGASAAMTVTGGHADLPLSEQVTSLVLHWLTAGDGA